MFQRQRSGSVVCPGCGRLVGVSEPRCPHCGRSAPGMFGYARALRGVVDGEGFVRFVIVACALFYVASFLWRFPGLGAGNPLQFLSPSSDGLRIFGASGWVPVFEDGRWWTVLSAGWLHGSLLHIVFNMMWIRSLAPALVRFLGPGRTILVYVISGVAGFALTSIVGRALPGLPGMLRGAHVTVGASAAIFGLLGALVLYSRRTGSGALGRQLWTWALVLFVFGLVVPGIDNYAHLGGFVGGYATAAILDPLEPERPEHLVLGLVGLALSLLAVVVSVVTVYLPR